MKKYRLDKITTKSGDAGSSTLVDKLLPKDDCRFMAIGDIDELNAAIGLLMAALSNHCKFNQQLYNWCAQLQHKMFDIGAELALSNRACFIWHQDVKKLENFIFKHNRQLEPLAEFILPSGSEAVARAHLARAICRRAERSLVKIGNVSPLTLAYINRLSDALFVLARVIAPKNNYWQQV